MPKTPVIIYKVISAIIPTYNSQSTLEDCLKSIKNQNESFEIIVVDNYSTDQTIKIANKFTRSVYQKGPERSAQRNYGANKAHGDWLLFLDSDQALSENCCQDGIKTAIKNNLDAVIIPEEVKGSGFWSKVLDLEKQIYTTHKSVSTPRFIKNSAFQKLQGFDANLIAAEDWDLTQRLTKNGYKIGFSKALIYNLEENSTLTSIIKKKYYYARDINKYAQKHPRSFISQANFISRLTNADALAKMAKDPAHAAGLLFLKSAQAIAAIVAQF